MYRCLVNAISLALLLKFLANLCQLLLIFIILVIIFSLNFRFRQGCHFYFLTKNLALNLLLTNDFLHLLNQNMQLRYLVLKFVACKVQAFLESQLLLSLSLLVLYQFELNGQLVNGYLASWFFVALSTDGLSFSLCGLQASLGSFIVNASLLLLIGQLNYNL